MLFFRVLLCICMFAVKLESLGEQTPKVSVLMPVYNTKEEYLREAIESILNQTYTNFELVILDDGSTTDIEKVVTSYKDKRIRFHKSPKNLGISLATNKLMDMAKGEFISLMDSDDIAIKSQLQKEVDYLDKNPTVSIVSCAYKEFPINTRSNPPRKARYLDLMFFNFMSNPGCMMRLADINKYKLRYDPKFPPCQDYEFWSRAIRHLKIENIQEILQKHRRHPNNFLQTHSSAEKQNNYVIRKRMAEYLTENRELQREVLCLMYPSPFKVFYLKVMEYINEIFSDEE